VANPLLRLGIIILFAGLALILLSALLQTLTSANQGGVSSGVTGCVILLFIPICFGLGNTGFLPIIISLSLILTLALILINFLILRKFAGSEQAE
jgi:uncharacterized membrane protein